MSSSSLRCVLAPIFLKMKSSSLMAADAGFVRVQHFRVIRGTRTDIHAHPYFPGIYRFNCLFAFRTGKQDQLQPCPPYITFGKGEHIYQGIHGSHFD